MPLGEGGGWGERGGVRSSRGGGCVWRGGPTPPPLSAPPPSLIRRKPATQSGPRDLTCSKAASFLICPTWCPITIYPALCSSNDIRWLKRRRRRRRGGGRGSMSKSEGGGGGAVSWLSFLLGGDTSRCASSCVYRSPPGGYVRGQGPPRTGDIGQRAEHLTQTQD